MPTLLSVDIWDTLLRRRCHPDEVKLATARTLMLWHRDELAKESPDPFTLVNARVDAEAALARERETRGFDNEYAAEEVFDRWLARVMRPGVSGARRAAIAQMLLLAEIEQEKCVVYPDSRMAWLLRHPTADRLVAISDFYLGESHMRSIVAHALPDLRLERVFVSCDSLLNKQRGRIFTLAQREMRCEPDHHTHIGDHIWSDVESPRKLGVRAVHYHNPDEEPRRAAHRVRFEARRRGDFSGTAALLTDELRDRCQPPAPLAPDQHELYIAGFRAAPLFASVVLAASTQALRVGARGVHYFTREGEFFLAMHEAMAPHRPLGVPHPSGTLLEVSRLATFLPSLREVTTRELRRVWNMYSRQSLGQLLTTLGVPGIPFEPLLARAHIDPDEIIAHPWKDPRVQRLFADRLFVRMVEQHRDRARALLMEYLERRGLRDAGHAVVVDIGWRGTIHDNLAHLLPHARLHGWYLALFKLLNEQPANASKHSMGPDARRDSPRTMDILRWVGPVEMLTNSPSGSVRTHRRDAAGVPVAVRDRHEEEDRVWSDSTRHFQQGALAAAPIVARWCRTHAVMPDELRPLSMALLRELTAFPPVAAARAYFRLHHNETFGVGAVVRKPGELPRAILKRGLASDAMDPVFVAHIEASAWPQGLLRLHGQDDLCRLYTRSRGASLSDLPPSAAPAPVGPPARTPPPEATVSGPPVPETKPLRAAAGARP